MELLSTPEAYHFMVTLSLILGAEPVLYLHLWVKAGVLCPWDHAAVREGQIFIGKSLKGYCICDSTLHLIRTNRDL